VQSVAYTLNCTRIGSVGDLGRVPCMESDAGEAQKDLRRWRRSAIASSSPPVRVDKLAHNGAMNGVRMDKWLWAARFFKTRPLAARSCDLGRISCNGQPAKPAREVRVADMLQIKNEGGTFDVEVLVLGEVRGPAAVAQTLYRETDASRERRRLEAEARKAAAEFEVLPQGRPDKRDRQKLNRLRGR
jgi:ribosome-associated heat shock protein Hsp15